MRLTSNPDPKDGRLDLSIAGDLTKFQVLKLFPSLFNGKITRSKHVSSHKVIEVAVDITNESPLHVALNLTGSAEFVPGRHT